MSELWVLTRPDPSWNGQPNSCSWCGLRCAASRCPGAPRTTMMQRRKLNLKAKLKTSVITFKFQALRTRRFQHGFHCFNLHRLAMKPLSPTLAPRSTPYAASIVAMHAVL